MKQVMPQIETHLSKGKTITDHQCRALYGSISLKVFIHRLRKKGYTIITKMIRKGDDVYAKYSMIKN